MPHMGLDGSAASCRAFVSDRLTGRRSSAPERIAPCDLVSAQPRSCCSSWRWPLERGSQAPRLSRLLTWRPSQVGLIARVHAAAFGDANPTSAGFAMTTEQRGLAAIRGPSYAGDGPVFLVVLTGHFSGLPRPAPPGPSTPNSSVFSMLISADFVHDAYYPVPGTEKIADALPDLSGIGALTPLELPAAPVAPTPAATTCAEWAARSTGLTRRIAHMRAIAATSARPLTRQLAAAAAGRLIRSRVGYLILVRQLCTQAPWRAVAFSLRFPFGPPGGSTSVTVDKEPQTSALGALLPTPLPTSVADPTCVVRPLAAPTFTPPLVLRITLSDGRHELEQSYPTCHLPSPLEPVRAALGYIADPCECPHG
jgi:hypothetical protein